MIEPVGELARFSHVGKYKAWACRGDGSCLAGAMQHDDFDGLQMLELRGFCFDARICFPYQENLRHMPNVYIYIYIMGYMHVQKQSLARCNSQSSFCF